MLEALGEKGVIEKKVGSYRDCGGRRRQPRSTWGCAVAHVCAGPEDAPAAGFERRAELRPAVWSAPGGPGLSGRKRRAQLASVGLRPPSPPAPLSPASRPRNYLKRCQCDSRAPLGWVLLFLCFNDSSQPFGVSCAINSLALLKATGVIFLLHHPFGDNCLCCDVSRIDFSLLNESERERGRERARERVTDVCRGHI